MNKRLFIYIFTLLVITPLVFADVNIEGFERERYNIGESLTISGNILHTESLTGLLKINVICGEETTPAFFSLVNLEANKKYEFLEKIPVLENTLGNCNLNVALDDLSGNNLFEESSNNVEISNELRIDAQINNPVQKPGNIARIIGTIRSINGVRSDQGTITFLLNGRSYADTYNNGDFSFELTLSEVISSGDHTITISAADDKGNFKEEDLTFEILPVQKELEINLAKSVYLPGTELPLDILLLDQASEILPEKLSVEILDPQGDVHTTLDLTSGDVEILDLEPFAFPGKWKIRTSTDKLSVEETFVIETVYETESNIEGNILTIRNIGNVDYIDPIEINLEGESKTYTVTEKKTLEPNETLIIDLSKEAPDGAYSINVPGAAITGNVVIEGGRASGSSLLGYGALFFVTIFLVYMVLNRSKKRFVSNKEDVDTVAKQETPKKEKEKEYKNPSPTKEDVEFLLNKVQREEEKKEQDPGSLFDIFNK